MPIAMNSFRGLCLALPLTLAFAITACGEDNQLTEAEKKDGWKLLFDGTSTTGWVTRGSDKLVNWQAVDGVLRRTAKGGDAVYQAEQFGDFSLSIDWKVADQGNSGVFVRTSSLADWKNTGAEIQILDLNAPKENHILKHTAGALYDLVEPATDAPVMLHGEWNHFDITCDGPHMSAAMNGKQTFAVNLDDERWKTPQGKFKKPYGTLPRIGWLMLQDHSSDVEFKNIKIRVLHAP